MGVNGIISGVEEDQEAVGDIGRGSRLSGNGRKKSLRGVDWGGKGEYGVVVWVRGKGKEVGAIRLYSRSISVDGGPSGGIKRLTQVPRKGAGMSAVA